MKKEKQNVTTETDKTLRETTLHPDEMDLIYMYRIMNDKGRHALIKMALDFARTPTMRKICVRGM